ncbi:hypothetical protein ACI0FR_02777 [Paenochrobactrum sp. BZR 201-1]|uniref:hypothetical protein n=1 Tax=Paenochrobactrum sp. BZR 201-1 TaxID=3378075 RepID=UPI00385329D8
MKIYTVMPAFFKVSDDEEAMVFTGTTFDPMTFTDAADARECAKEQARQHRGRHVWIVEGTATESFHCEPEPVITGAPVVQRLA